MNSKSQPIPPIPPDAQPTGTVAAKCTDVVELRRDIRSPKLPLWATNRVTVQPRNGLGQKVRGWGE